MPNRHISRSDSRTKPKHSRHTAHDTTKTKEYKYNKAHTQKKPPKKKKPKPQTQPHPQPHQKEDIISHFGLTHLLSLLSVSISLHPPSSTTITTYGYYYTFIKKKKLSFRTPNINTAFTHKRQNQTTPPPPKHINVNFLSNYLMYDVLILSGNQKRCSSLTPTPHHPHSKYNKQKNQRR